MPFACAIGAAASDWFDEFSKPHRESGNVPGSVPELVYQACELAFTRKDGEIW